MIVSLLPAGDALYRCGNENCSATLRKCHNYEHEHVCNRCVVASNGAPAGTLCDCCRFNATIPDLAVPGNREKWYRLEAAKRRLVYELELLGLPVGGDAVGAPPVFKFMADVDAGKHWHSVDSGERVYTGHSAGTITINLAEADDVERERLRVDLNEPHRTLIGHFRHEIAHYFWDRLVRDRCEESSRAVFGDHHSPYAEALKRHYRRGPRSDWAESFISAYASAHPWEDFAETFAAYLAMVSVLDTAANVGLESPAGGVRQADFAAMIARYADIGLIMNEINRSQGLVDLVPVTLSGAVIEKLRFVHGLLRRAAVAFPRPC